MKINKRSVSDSQIDEKRDNKEKCKKSIITFVICFFLVLFALLNIPFFNISPPYSWAKTSLSTSVTPKNLQRGNPVFFSGTLSGDDIKDKTVALQVVCDEGDVVTTFTATTNSKGIFDYTWDVPDDCGVGKHSITATYEMLSSTENFMVKLAAPQKYGGKYFN